MAAVVCVAMSRIETGLTPVAQNAEGVLEAATTMQFGTAMAFATAAAHVFVV